MSVDEPRGHNILHDYYDYAREVASLFGNGIRNYNGRYAMPKKKKKRRRKKKGKADLTTVLHIRELPHLHMKLAHWFSFLTTNNKNPMIPS